MKQPEWNDCVAAIVVYNNEDIDDDDSDGDDDEEWWLNDCDVCCGVGGLREFQVEVFILFFNKNKKK